MQIFPELMKGFFSYFFFLFELMRDSLSTEQEGAGERKRGRRDEDREEREGMVKEEEE